MKMIFGLTDVGLISSAQAEEINGENAIAASKMKKSILKLIFRMPAVNECMIRSVYDQLLKRK
jgi:hypothetical protein